jgi:hypothetical protein
VIRAAHDSRAAMLTRLLLIFTASALLLALGMERRLSVYDEGVILTGAMRVAAGDVPHRDFYANYGPGAFYAIAALFKLFGQYALLERVYDVLVRAAIVTLCYALAARLARTRVALGVAAAVGLWLFGIGVYGYPIFPVVLLCLVAVALVQPVLAGRRSVARLVGAGAVTGLAALIRYDAGPVLFLALAALLAISGALRSGSVRHALSPLSLYTLGTAGVILPVAAGYLAVAPLEAFMHDIFYFSIPNYARMRGMPFPGFLETIESIDKVAIYMPVAICCAAAWSLIQRPVHIAIRGRPSPDAVEEGRDWLLVTLTVITAAFYLKGLVRVSVAHLVASIVPSIVLLGALIDRARIQGRPAQVAVGALCALTLASALSATTGAAEPRALANSSVFAMIRSAIASPAGVWCPTPPELRSIRCLLLDPNREEAARFIAANTRPDERIFVGLTRHDKIFVNDNMMYFATGRMPATRWHHFDSGLQTSAAVQREMIAELGSREVRYVVLESTWDEVMEPNGSAQSSGVHLLDEYVRANYQPVRRYADIWVLRLKRAPE